MLANNPTTETETKTINKTAKTVKLFTCNVQFPLALWTPNNRNRNEKLQEFLVCIAIIKDPPGHMKASE